MIFKSIALAAVLLVAGAAQAGEFTPAPHGTVTLDLDTAGGHFSEWKTSELDGINALRLHTTFVQRAQDKQYAPNFNVVVEGADRKAWLQFGAFKDKGPLSGKVFVTVNGKTQPGDELVMLPPDLGETFDIYVRWTREGKVSFDIYDKANAGVGHGFEHHEVNLGGAVTGMSVSNSTGEVLLDPLQIGSEAP